MHLIIPRKEEEGDCLNDDTRKLTVKVLIGISVTSWCILLFAFFGGIEEYQESVIQVSCCMPFVLLFLAQLIWESTEEQKKIFLERRRKRNKAAGYRPEFWDMSPEEITVAANIAYEKKREEELRSLREIALERDPIIRKMTTRNTVIPKANSVAGNPKTFSITYTTSPSFIWIILSVLPPT